ncbi:hypothetical protein E1B28_004343 [Marasmius oreades]|uniref:MARVEL domain-containing protein n=1 Tax=Marasmius oreades TaxID=181124 RepID=A0A9P8AD47_9AGAR|nr:uncharacterized protein E1B28_004343 [Marasmius oreades]KAG7096945.1 hypothetical protein E1B28_004343 [Marasmius oreades]
MTVQFANYRLGFYVAVFLLSGTVLGLAAHFAAVFLPGLHHDFTIFALIVSSLTILAFLFTLQWAQPRIEVPVLFVLGVLWLAMGAWTTDVVGNRQCDAIDGATREGNISARQYCYETKVIQAFSWFLFSLFVIAFTILLNLISQAQRLGRYNIWREPIQELGWFGEWPGYYNTHQPQHYQGGIPYGMPMQMAPGQPGQTIIVQPGMNGAPATVQQIPMSTV